jgi:PAS domain S-box-containing protein
MSIADPRVSVVGTFAHLGTWPRRYGFAALAVAAATFAHIKIVGVLGPNEPFVLFYPAVAIVAIYAGLGAGLVATFLSAASAVYFLLLPAHSLRLGLSHNIVGMILFLCGGTTIALLSEAFRWRQNRLQEFERVVEGVEASVFVLDRNYRYVVANRAFLDSRGRTREELIGRSAIELMGAHTFDTVYRSKIEECFRGNIVRFEKKAKGPSQSEQDYMVSYFPIEGQNGIARVACIMQDVTEFKRAEHSMALFRTLIDQSNDAVEVVDPKTLRFIDINEKACSDLGYTRQELLALTLFDIDPTLDEAVRRRISERLRLSGSVIEQTIHQRKDGSRFPVEISVRQVRLDRDYVVTVARDITDRKVAEDALRESEDRYRDLVEHSEELVCTHDLAGILLSVNPVPARLLGYEVAEMLKIPMREMIAPEYRELFDEYLDRIARTGADKGLMVVLTRKGEPRVWEYSNTLRTEGVPAPIVRGMARDITDRRRIEDALRRREEDYRSFVAQSSEGIFRQDLDEPIAVDLPEDEMARRILYGSYMAECNDAMARMYGFVSGQELTGMRLTQMLIADDPLNIELTRDYIRSGFRVLDRKSNEVDVQGNQKVFLNSMIGIVEDGKLMRTWGIQRDITEAVKADEGRRKAELLLAESEKRFRLAIKNSPITVFNQDRDLRYTWVYNPHLHWQEEVMGKTDDEIIGVTQAARLNELKRRVLETKTGLREEVAIEKGGRKIAFDITLEPILDSSGEVVGITGTSMDIARLREAADILQEARDKLLQDKQYLSREIEATLGFEEIVGQSAALNEVLRKTKIVAPTGSTVLLLGETGTGKELVARAVHKLSSQRDKNFIKLNCAAVPSGLLESELFGHEKGAFTGAVSQKMGRIELADKGTLFLDEIGEMPLELQPKILRVLQDREFERLGGLRTLRVDVRIIAATNRDLRVEVADKKFREDLFYRLNVFPINLPPLRERRSDIPLLVDHFVGKHAVRMKKQIRTIPSETMAVLQNWNWPGNVRELENMIERMVILTKGDVLAPPPAELEAEQDVPEDHLTEMEREHIIRILRETNGVLSGVDGAAHRLGIKRTTLQSMLKRLKIEPQHYIRGSGTPGRN